MKKLGMTVTLLFVLTVFFGVKDLSVGDAISGGIKNVWGAINILFGGNINASNNRPLPPNQGDDSEPSITPIESLEDVE
ncbi:MAG: hypothetical protein ACKPH7_35780 [Planktothrix sp.]|uniref:hypothetical protein n=1 Tax=Planktothrix sp. TaxID=3088171 RepID=UPI0038D3ACF1